MTLSPSDFTHVGPVGPYGTLFPSDPAGPYEPRSPSDSDSVGPVDPCVTLSPSDFTLVGPVGPYGTLSPLDSTPVGPSGTLSPSDLDSVCPVGLCVTLSPCDSSPVGPVGPCGTLSPSDFDSVGLCGTLSPSDSTPVGPLGLCGTLSPSDPVGPVCPYGMLSPSDSDYVGPVSPFGTLSMPGAVYNGPTGQVEMTSVFDHRNRLSPVARPGREISSADRARWVPGELVPGISADPTASKDPMIPFLPADGPVGDVTHAVDMDAMRNSYPTVPAIGNCRAVVAMVGLEGAQRREEAPREYGSDCVEWDIRNEFETIDGMPVYYGVDLCDSDGSEWDNPWDLAHGEHVERYNFDALDGMELKVFERSKAVNEPTMMVREVPGRGPIRQDLNAPQVEAIRLDSAGVGELFTERSLQDSVPYGQTGSTGSDGDSVPHGPTGPTGVESDGDSVPHRPTEPKSDGDSVPHGPTGQQEKNQTGTASHTSQRGKRSPSQLPDGSLLIYTILTPPGEKTTALCTRSGPSSSHACPEDRYSQSERPKSLPPQSSSPIIRICVIPWETTPTEVARSLAHNRNRVTSSPPAIITAPSPLICHSS